MRHITAMKTIILNAIIVVGAVSVFCPLGAQASPAKSFQNNQIGVNTFVTGPQGEVLLILNTDLFRNTSLSGDAWSRIATNVKAVALDPDNEKVIYALSTQNTVMKTMDQGAHWLVLDTSTPNQTLIAIFVNPANTQQVYTGGADGLLKTDNAGFSWQRTSFTRPVNQIVIDPLAPNVLYVLSGGGIYISADQGTTWKRSETGLPTVLVRGAGRTATRTIVPVSLIAAIDRQKPGLLAATIGKGIYRTEDNGATWAASSTGLSLGEGFLAASVGKEQITLASSSSLFRSTNGTNWSRVNIESGTNTPVTFLGVIDYPFKTGLLLNFRFPQDGDIENVGQQRRIGFLDEQGMLVGLNYGVLQHSEVDSVWTAIRDGKPVFFVVTFNGYDLDQVEAWHRPNFLYMSRDSGHSWDLLGRTECGTLATRPAGSNSEVWVYGSDSCVMRTTDGGQTWTHMPGFDFLYYQAKVTDLKFDPVRPNVLYYSTGVNERHIMRYQFNRGTGQGQAVDLKTYAEMLVVDQSSPNAIFTDQAQLSTDGGWTWTDKSGALSSACRCDIKNYYNGGPKPLSFHGGEIRILIAFGADAFNSYPGEIDVMRSLDLGDSWDRISKLAVSGLRAGPFVNPDDSQDVFIAAVFGQEKGPGGFGLGPSYRVDTLKVLETSDGGGTWKEIYTRPVSGEHPGEGFLHGVTQFKRNGGRSILLATSDGLIRSDDEGQTWSRLGGIDAESPGSNSNDH